MKCKLWGTVHTALDIGVTIPQPTSKATQSIKTQHALQLNITKWCSIPIPSKCQAQPPTVVSVQIVCPIPAL